MLDKQELNGDLLKSIQDTLDYVNKEKAKDERLRQKQRKNKKLKDNANKRLENHNKIHALDSLVDDLLQMKEGERKAQLIRPIIPIREWLSNEYYCGAEVFNLYPFWKEHLIKIYESPVLINEIILTGRIRNW